MSLRYVVLLCCWLCLTGLSQAQTVIPPDNWLEPPAFPPTSSQLASFARGSEPASPRLQALYLASQQGSYAEKKLPCKRFQLSGA